MKIFGIEGNYNTAACTRQGDGTGADAPVLFTKCDTALLKDSKPFFIPDHLGTITAAVHLVVRICRLGKTIDCDCESTLETIAIVPKNPLNEDPIPGETDSVQFLSTDQ